MSKITFNDEQIQILSKNPYVLKISNKTINYSEEFKRKFIVESSKGILPKQIFRNNGFDPNVLGIKRIEQCASRWRKKYLENGILGLKDTRANNTGRPLLNSIPVSEEIIRLKARIKILEDEIKVLKELNIKLSMK